jgi:hypothetical protein
MERPWILGGSMKKVFVFCFVVLLASSGLAQNSAEASKAEGILLAMEKTWTDAIAKKTWPRWD